VGTLLQTLRYSLPPPLKKPIFLVDNSYSTPFSYFTIIRFYPLKTKNTIIEHDYSDKFSIQNSHSAFRNLKKLFKHVHIITNYGHI
jgi:hypothetical protein